MSSKVFNLQPFAVYAGLLAAQMNDVGPVDGFNMGDFDRAKWVIDNAPALVNVFVYERVNGVWFAATPNLAPVGAGVGLIVEMDGMCHRQVKLMVEPAVNGDVGAALDVR